LKNRRGERGVIMLIKYFIFAYVGPGLGLGAIGAVIAGTIAFFAVILGFVFYPIKKMIMKFKSKKPGKQQKHISEINSDNINKKSLRL